MPDGSELGSVEVLGSVADVPAADWDACAGDNPFVGHAFLTALETSGSADAASGWLPRHLGLRTPDGRLQACMPLYLKSHSYGEYVFDWGWADAWQRAGRRYYPKLQGAVPFTPVPGPRLLVRPGAPDGAADALATAAVRLAERLGVSSLHVTFASDAECARLARHGFLHRIGHQYHWHNRGYESFEAFLSDLTARKRKAIRKERARVADSGIVLRTLQGDEIRERHWDAFWRFYLDTVERKWAHAYLNREFFSRLGETLADRVVMIVAETDRGEPVGGALNLRGPDALYGRYWGCVESCRFLHFEACYYRAIDYAIEHRLDRVEAGAQGEHKVQRGYVPRFTHSAHWIADRGFKRAVERFLETERQAIEADAAALEAASPFRRGDEAS